MCDWCVLCVVGVKDGRYANANAMASALLSGFEFYWVRWGAMLGACVFFLFLVTRN
jgi:hypothetical protein